MRGNNLTHSGKDYVQPKVTLRLKTKKKINEIISPKTERHYSVMRAQLTSTRQAIGRVIASIRPTVGKVGRLHYMGELQYPGAPSVDDERQYRAPFRRAPQYRWPAPQPPQPSAFAPWRRAPAPPRPPDYRRSASYPGKPDEPYQVTYDFHSPYCLRMH